MKKRICCFLAALVALFAVGCAPAEKEVRNAPDYSDSTLQFDFYAYHPPTDGNYENYGVKYSTGENYRTVERYQQYRDSGCNLLMLFHPEYTGNWENSETKRVVDTAYEGGNDRIIVRDTRLAWMSHGLTIDGEKYKKERLVGEGEKFATEAELDAYVASCLADYIDHPAVYGVMLQDEPTYSKLGMFGDMYASIKRVAPELFVQINLLPMIINLSWYDGPDPVGAETMNEDELREAKYRMYLERFLETSGADYFQVDQYPMNGSSIYQTYMRCLQICAEVAKKHDVDLYFVTQTCTMTQNGISQRQIKEEDARWLNNMLVGFGVKTIFYWTYWCRNGSSQQEAFDDYTSFISTDGQVQPLYYTMQQIMKEEQQFAPTVLNFEYSDSMIYSVKPLNYLAQHTLRFQNGTLKKVVDVSSDKEIVLITELVDHTKGNYMYMVQNIIDPLYKSNTTNQTVTLTFSDEYEYAVVWERGERTLVELDNHQYTVKQHPGDAVYVMPY